MLYIVGKRLGPSDCQECRSEDEWEFMGVFDSREAAIAACSDASMFVGPAELNMRCGNEPEYWPEAFYPMAEQAKAS